MDKLLVEEVIECLPDNRTLFHYFKDRYVWMLLSSQVEKGKTVRELKQGPFKALIDKPMVKEQLAALGGSKLTNKWLSGLWADELYPFVLTLSEWGGQSNVWQQTCRNGYNLVLQLNFSNAHQDAYKSLVKPTDHAMLNHYGHPVLRDGKRETLAWARIDLDFTTGEALIEEIQSDWVREAQDMVEDAQRCQLDDIKELSWYSVKGKPADIIQYMETVLAPYRAFWDEAMLAASIEFIRDELGIKQIYYHSHDTGWRVKGIYYSKPPRSLYSTLPRRFCFRKTADAPEFLKADKRFRRVCKKVSDPIWYNLNFNM